LEHFTDNLFSMRSDALSSLRYSLERLTPFGQGSSARVLGLGIPALDAALPQRGLAYGSVTELQVQGTSGAATSFALCACRAAQQRSFRQQPFHQPFHQQPVRSPWCAFIDPTATLFAPGVARLGVDLGHLLVVRPEIEAVNRVAIRIAEANLVSVLVIDLTGALPHGCAHDRGQPAVDEHSWQRTVRRLALAVKSAPICVLLITRTEQFQSLPLPTFMRLEFARRSAEAFDLHVAKDRTGRVSTAQNIAHAVFEPNQCFEQGNSLEPIVAARQVS
jgi:hypothetical protein